MNKSKTLTLRNHISKDDCFRTAIANVLQIHPKKVPDFVKLYGLEFVDGARRWLNKRNKTITFCHVKSFLESGTCRYNAGLFPQGLCIVILDDHAETMCNGKTVGHKDGPRSFYDDLAGYFIIHDYYPYKIKKK